MLLGTCEEVVLATVSVVRARGKAGRDAKPERIRNRYRRPTLALEEGLLFSAATVDRPPLYIRDRLWEYHLGHK